MACSKVKEAKRLKVVEVVEKEDRKARPSGLNTVELLKVWWIDNFVVGRCRLCSFNMYMFALNVHLAGLSSVYLILLLLSGRDTQIASSMLNMGPAYTMQMAERLYIQVGNYPQMPLMIELKTSVDIAQFNVF